MNYLLYDFTCASMASMLTLFAAHPFDTIKVRFISLSFKVFKKVLDNF